MDCSEGEKGREGLEGLVFSKGKKVRGMKLFKRRERGGERGNSRVTLDLHRRIRTYMVVVVMGFCVRGGKRFEGEGERLT